MKTLALSLLAALACTTAVRADAVYDNTPTPIANATVGSSIGQSFVTGGTALSLNAFLFAQFNVGNVAYTFTTGETVSLYANNPLDNTPVTTLSLASFSVAPNTFSPGFTEADTTALTILNPNSRYWLVLSAPTVADTVYWSFANPSGYKANTLYGVDLPAANTAYKIPQGGGTPTFFTFAQGPQSIYLDADVVTLPVVPEPSTYAMFAVGGVGAFLFMRRTRKVKAV